MSETFPDGFVWGVAASSFQIEGATNVGGRGPSIWDHFAAQPGKIADGSDGSVACDHYHRFRDDVGIIQSLGVAAYRFSIAWPRIFPNGRGKAVEAGLDFYDQLVDELLSAGVQPCATLYHWDLPQALEEEGGWTRRSTAEAFADYADVVSRRLGDRVKDWITHNEPWCAAVLGYAHGVHAPGKKSWPDALAASHHLLLSHGWAIPALRFNSPGCKIGITLNTADSQAASPSEADRDAARLVDGELNRWYLDPLYRGEYPADMIEHYRASGHLPNAMYFVHPGDLDVIRTPTDFLGINYYTRSIVRSDQIAEEENAPRTIPVPDADRETDMGWEVYPDSLTDILLRLTEDYGPASIVVTENGAAYGTGPDPDGRVRDVRRREYVESHLRACLAAIQAGVPLDGYYLWSIFDNFEWAEGYTKRFGIVWVDFETQERIIKESGHWYRQVARTNRIPEEQAA